MKTTEIRQTFLDYFRDAGHENVRSSSLVPGNDPTLLFTNAGMVQFKDVFLGQDKRSYQRAVTSQRCVRAGGKHNDLENVGYTERHLTFFEMLGNFSFGDYFKREAINFAWTLLTQHFKLPAEKLWITVFEDDEEAADIWLHEIRIPKHRFARIGAQDNFWSMGDTGPCGPCTEIFYDHGPDVAGGPPGSPEEDGDRYVEIWNLVFMQFDRAADGSMVDLPRPSVDTGMGLERLAAVLQNVHSVYQTDLFTKLISAAAQAVEITDLEHKSLRVIADHIRSTAFLIVDGVTPSNEGRGYVLRRIVRRAIRHGYQLGQTQPFFHHLVPTLVAEMGDAYPELAKAQALVERILEQEGERFVDTLEQGIKILDQEISALNGTVIPGDVVFKLYDTYGFPVDLTNDIAREKNLTLDIAGFEAAMQSQRTRARAASQFASVQQISVNIDEATQFTGYESTAGQGTVLAIVQNEQPVDSITAGEDAVVVLDSTPFYAEAGGQVGDKGKLRNGQANFAVADTQKLANSVIGHFGNLRMGSLAIGDCVKTDVNDSERADTVNNHSATHLLHAALKEQLGTHVQQKGSLVEADRLRFDFSHFEALTAEQIVDIECSVNGQIRANHPVTVQQMALDDAKAAGAEALFGEKYSEQVRTIRMGEFSFELCGGTHVARTGDIGLFKIVSESGIAAGIRRIEALTGRLAFSEIQRQTSLLQQLSEQVKCSPNELLEKVSVLGERSKKLERQVEQLNTRLATASELDIDSQIREVNGVRLLVMRQDNTDVKSLRLILDKLKQKLGSAVILIGGVHDGKVTLIASVSKDLTVKVSAGNLIQSLASMVGGKGGGRADMAQGGGNDVTQLDQTLASVEENLKLQLV